jgi:hypothetical protein
VTLVAPSRADNSRIFISYRHTDSAAYAGRLYDRLKASYGDEQIFRDLDMDYGIDFVERIEVTISACAVMVVVIGPGWLNARDEAGNRRLDDPDDYVRVEVGSALERSIRVIPVLVGDAKMPVKTDLPDALSALTRRNALKISDDRWDYDVSRLMQTVDTVLQDREAKIAEQPAPTDEPSTSVVVQPPPSPTPETPEPERKSIPPPATEKGTHRQRAVIAAAAAAVVVAVVVIAVAAGGGGDGAGSSGGGVDQGSQNVDAAKLLDPVQVGPSPEGVAVARSVWVADDDGAVTSIDPKPPKRRKSVAVGIGDLDSVGVRGGSVWVTGEA